jgi:predicted nucleotidyltransferase
MASGTTVAEIRQHKREQHLSRLQAEAKQLIDSHPGGSLWLFGSLARGDWDAYSDVDMLAVAPTPVEADQLADAVLSKQLADDVIALCTSEWDRRAASKDPYWQAISRDARCLAKG